MKTIKHDMETWFKETNKTGMDYFNNSFKRNRIGNFNIQSSFRKRYDTDTLLEKIFNSIGEGYIDVIIKVKPILKKVPFSMLEKIDRGHLRELICELIQFGVWNKQIMQVVNTDMIVGGNTSLSISQTPWVFSLDMLSTKAKNLIQRSNLDDYDIIEEDVLYSRTVNGNIQILRVIEGDDVPAMVWDEE